MKRKPLTKKEVEELPLTPFSELKSFTRFKDGSIVWQGHPAYNPPRVKREFIPGIGYTSKLRRV